MTKYEFRDGLDGKVLVKIEEDGTESFVPQDPANSDYQAYLRWLNGEDEASGTL